MRMMISWLCVLPLAAAIAQPAELRIKKVGDFPIDNTIAGSWEQAEWIELPLRTRDQPAYRTRAKVLYSDTGIYFLIRCEDSKLTATMTQDFDDLWKEDVVEIFLWPDESHPLYFEYELSPLNYELPILVPNIDGRFLGWRPWRYFNERRVQHATLVEGGPKTADAGVTAWTAQFYIPFELLKPLGNVPPTTGTRWRANMYRLDYDKGQARWAWQPVRTNFHDFEMFGTFVFE